MCGLARVRVVVLLEALALLESWCVECQAGGKVEPSTQFILTYYI